MVVMFEYSHQMLIKNRSFIDGTLMFFFIFRGATSSTHEEKGTQLQTETLELLRDTDVDHGADAIGVALDQEELLAHLRSRKVTPDHGRLQTGADGVVFEDGILTSIGADNVWN